MMKHRLAGQVRMEKSVEEIGYLGIKSYFQISLKIKCKHDENKTKKNKINIKNIYKKRK